MIIGKVRIPIGDSKLASQTGKKEDLVDQKMRKKFRKAGPAKRSEIIYLADSDDPEFASKWTQEMHTPRRRARKPAKKVV